MEKLGIKTVCIIALILLSVITWWTAQYTALHNSILDYSYGGSETILICPDTPLKNLIAAFVLSVIFGFFMVFFHKKNEEQKSKFVKYFAIIELIGIGIFLTLWVTITKFEQSRDAEMVKMIAQEFLKGDYHNMKTNYIQYNHHQLNLLFLEEPILRLTGNPHVFQYINVVFILGIIFFLYRITDKMFHNQTVNFYCLLSIGGFLPMHLYVTLIYGDICSISLSLMAIWALLAWCDTKKKRHILIAVLGLTIATLARKNTLIIIVAIFISLFIYIIREREWRGVLIVLLISASIFSTMKFVPYYYEKRSGVELGDAMPAVLYIIMGMHNDDGGHGDYNGMHESIFWRRGQDAREASRYAKELIKENIQHYLDDPAFCLDFYKKKTIEQWGETTYGSLLLTYSDVMSKKGLQESKIVSTIYKSPFQLNLVNIQNYYAFAIYFFTLLFLVMALSGKKLKTRVGFADFNNIWCYLLMAVVIGGILFSILWEAKSRYVLGYVIFMIPYMACGIWQLQTLLKRVADATIRKRIV